MYIKVGKTILNTDNIVEVRVIPDSPASEEEETGEMLRAVPTRVEIATTAVYADYDNGGDSPHSAHYWARPYAITLHGDEAEAFLEALPTYWPVREES